jgi:hypothetical protein
MTGVEQLGQLFRLDRFRAQHADVTIKKHERFGFWEAWIPVSNGGTVVTRYVLKDLLDKLDDLLGPERSQARGAPDH